MTPPLTLPSASPDPTRPRPPRRRVARLAALWLGMLASGWTAPAVAQVRPTTVAAGLDHPWGLAFLPDGRMLVTERVGRMRIVGPDGRLGEPIVGLPAVQSGSQAGLLDLALDPGFADNRRVYWAYTEAASDRSGATGTAVARGRLTDNRLTEVEVIFREQPKVVSGANLGSRLAFGRDGRLFITLGDHFRNRDDAQSLASHHGKIVRIEADGRVPADNPFVGRPGALPAIWSYGHRNGQGLAVEPRTGELWEDEHGPQGGDELNLIVPGRNYGWPVITYGAEYGSGEKIGEGSFKVGMEQPLTYWVPSIATSGLAFLSSDRYPGWKGNAFVGALKARLLVRLELDGHRVRQEHRLLQSLGERIRDVRQGPDGLLYLLTDSDAGRIIRLDPGP